MGREKIQCIDYNAWEISFGKLHFVAIDMGDMIPLTTNLRHALSTPETQEKSQCVILHLALGIEWCGQHYAKRVPSKTRVMQLASQLRAEEYQQAQSCLNAIHTPSTQKTFELWEGTHDVMMVNHDRNFHTMNWFVLSNLKIPPGVTVRVFDVAPDGPGYRVNVFEFDQGVPSLPLDQCISLVVWNQHMRFLKPSPECTPTVWRDWREHFGNVVYHSCMDWREALDRDDNLVVKPELSPCKWCSKPCRLQGEVFSNTGMEGDGDDQYEDDGR